MTADSAEPWWRCAVFYEIYVRSFADGNGDGVGDLAGIRSRLLYLKSLGVDALWLTPFYPSPMVDHGYDVSDPRDVEPIFGDLGEFDALVSDAHALGLKVTIDIVPNHTSDRHPWFQAAMTAPPGSPERERYLFRDGRGPHGDIPPNNWLSVMGGPAWRRESSRGQYYLHLFAPEQPDLNWRNAEVRADAEATLRFWLDRGVDGFRIDVAHGLLKDEQLRDNPGNYDPDVFGHGAEEVYAWNQPGVHAIFRDWRRVLDSYPGDRMATGEVWVRDKDDVVRYVREDELHLAFNFHFLFAPWDARELRTVIDAEIEALNGVKATPTWVLSNHDVIRHPTRLGGGAVGTRRARAAALLLLALPGAAYLYNGEELGLDEVDLPDEVRQDPSFLRTGGQQKGRDGARVPLPWSGDEPPFGFSPPGTRTWLPQPPEWRDRTVARQQQDPASMLTLYQSALRLRRAEPALGTGTLRWQPAGSDVLHLERAGENGAGPPVACLVNLGPAPVAMPPGRVLLASLPDVAAPLLPPDTAVWLRPD